MTLGARRCGRRSYRRLRGRRGSWPWGRTNLTCGARGCRLCNRRHDHRHGVRHMLQRRACGRINTHSNNAAKDNIARKARRPRSGQLRFYRHCLLLKAGHGEGHSELVLAAHLQRAGRCALMTKRGARRCARGLRHDLHLVGGPARHGCAAGERKASNANKKYRAHDGFNPPGGTRPRRQSPSAIRRSS